MHGKKIINNLPELVSLFKEIKSWDWSVPLAIEYCKKDEHRNLSQNALSHVWYRDAAKQLGDTEIWEVAGACKLDYALPILLGDDDTYNDIYKYCLEPYTREERIEILGKGYVACTRLLNKKQYTEYLQGVQNYYGKNGIRLMASGEYQDIMSRMYHI